MWCVLFFLFFAPSTPPFRQLFRIILIIKCPSSLPPHRAPVPKSSPTYLNNLNRRMDIRPHNPQHPPTPSVKSHACFRSQIPQPPSPGPSPGAPKPPDADPEGMDTSCAIPCFRIFVPEDRFGGGFAVRIGIGFAATTIVFSGEAFCTLIKPK